MKRVLGLGGALLAIMAAAACTGPAGPAGKDGKDGTNAGTGGGAVETPSVSAVTPASAYLGRTLDLTIAGSGTAWSSSTTVSFADPKITVNKVTAASATGLLVNVTVAKDATVAATDVTVKDGSNMEVYKGAFEIKSPIKVTTTPATGVPQGGTASIHVQMLDVSTPFDASTATVALSSSDVTVLSGQSTDYGLDLTVQADVLAKAGAVDLTASSGPTGSVIDSPAAQAFTIVARTPVTLSSASDGTGTIQTETDSALFQYTPSAASQRFLQWTINNTTSGGQVLASVVPKSGKFSDAVNAGFGGHFGLGATSTDPYYVIVADSNGLFGAGPTPADFTITTLDVACTAASETAETAAANNDAASSAQSVSTLPALVSGALGYGTVTGDSDVDVYQITVTGAPKKIHVATGGDAKTDSVLEVLDTSKTSLGTSDDLDYQEDFVVDAPKDGTYYVSVSASTGGYFDPTHNTYQLFIEVK